MALFSELRQDGGVGAWPGPGLTILVVYAEVPVSRTHVRHKWAAILRPVLKGTPTPGRWGSVCRLPARLATRLLLSSALLIAI